MNAAANVEQAEKLNLLFIDDEKNILIPLRAIFKRSYQVYTASSGREALQLMHEHPMHVVVSDQRMPEMSGVELLEKVRHYSPSTVRILLTGYSDLTAAIGSINEGAVFRFIEKPWDNTHLKETVDLAAEVARYHLNSNPGTFKLLPTPEMIDAEIQTADSARQTPPLPLHGPGSGRDIQLDPDLPQANILVVDNDLTVLKEINRIFGRSRQVLFASGLDEAVMVLNKYQIGVMMIDVRVHGEDSLGLINVLKQRYPALVTMVMTRDADTTHVIRLINQGQVFRYFTKPVRSGLLKLSLQSAIRYHDAHRQDDSLARIQPVEAPTEPDVQHSSNRFLGSLKSLWSRVLGR